MTKIITSLISFLVMIMMCTKAPAQAASETTKKYPVPEFINHPEYYGQDENKLVELEKPQTNTKRKKDFATGLLGLVKINTYMTIDNGHSPVRVKKRDTLLFIIRVNPGDDPSAIAELTGLKVEKKERKVLIADQKPFQSSEPAYKKIEFAVQKIQEGVYLLIMTHLASGEYCMATPVGVFAFGIDG